MNRPEPPQPAPEGFEWVPTDETRGPLQWTLRRPMGGLAANRCRYVLSAGQQQQLHRYTCGRPAVTWLNLGRLRPSWYAYCEQHLFGRWIEDGKVWSWRLRSTASATVERRRPAGPAGTPGRLPD